MILSTLVNLASQQLPGILMQLLRTQLLKAAQDYCDDGNGWLVENVEVTLAAGQTIFPFLIPANSKIVRVLKQRSTDSYKINVSEITKTGLFLNTALSAEQVVSFTLVVKPTSLEADMDIDSDEPIINGTLFRCKRMTGMPWSDMDGALYYRKEFLSDIHDAKQRSWMGNHGGTRQVQQRKFL